MNHLLAVLLMTVALAPVSLAQIAQPNVSKYTSLWRESRMTVPPDPPAAPEEENILENYALLSVSPLGGEYMVTMRDTKDPKRGKVRIIPGSTSSHGFKVVAVEQDPNNYLNTKVKVSVKGKEGYITYNEKELTLKTPSNPKKQVKKPGGQQPARNTPPRPGGGQPVNRDLQKALQGGGRSNASSGGQATPATRNKPRVRRVPTPPGK